MKLLILAVIGLLVVTCVAGLPGLVSGLGSLKKPLDKTAGKAEKTLGPIKKTLDKTAGKAAKPLNKWGGEVTGEADQLVNDDDQNPINKVKGVTDEAKGLEQSVIGKDPINKVKGVTDEAKGLGQSVIGKDPINKVKGVTDKVNDTGKGWKQPVIDEGNKLKKNLSGKDDGSSNDPKDDHFYYDYEDGNNDDADLPKNLKKQDPLKQLSGVPNKVSDKAKELEKTVKNKSSTLNKEVKKITKNVSKQENKLKKNLSGKDDGSSNDSNDFYHSYYDDDSTDGNPLKQLSGVPNKVSDKAKELKKTVKNKSSTLNKEVKKITKNVSKQENKLKKNLSGKDYGSSNDSNDFYHSYYDDDSTDGNPLKQLSGVPNKVSDKAKELKKTVKNKSSTLNKEVKKITKNVSKQENKLKKNLSGKDDGSSNDSNDFYHSYYDDDSTDGNPLKQLSGVPNKVSDKAKELKKTVKNKSSTLNKEVKKITKNVSKQGNKLKNNLNGKDDGSSNDPKDYNYYYDYEYSQNGDADLPKNLKKQDPLKQLSGVTNKVSDKAKELEKTVKNKSSTLNKEVKKITKNVSKQENKLKKNLSGKDDGSSNDSNDFYHSYYDDDSTDGNPLKQLSGVPNKVSDKAKELKKTVKNKSSTLNKEVKKITKNVSKQGNKLKNNLNGKDDGSSNDPKDYNYYYDYEDSQNGAAGFTKNLKKQDEDYDSSPASFYESTTTLPIGNKLKKVMSDQDDGYSNNQYVNYDYEYSKNGESKKVETVKGTMNNANNKGNGYGCTYGYGCLPNEITRLTIADILGYYAQLLRSNRDRC